VSDDIVKVHVDVLVLQKACKFGSKIILQDTFKGFCMTAIVVGGVLASVASISPYHVCDVFRNPPRRIFLALPNAELIGMLPFSWQFSLLAWGCHMHLASLR